MCWTPFKDEAQLHLSEHINSHNGRMRRTEYQQHCVKTLCICQTAFSAVCLNNGLWDKCSLKRPGGGGISAPAIIKH